MSFNVLDYDGNTHQVKTDQDDSLKLEAHQWKAVQSLAGVWKVFAFIRSQRVFLCDFVSNFHNTLNNDPFDFRKASLIHDPRAHRLHYMVDDPRHVLEWEEKKRFRILPPGYIISDIENGYESMSTPLTRSSTFPYLQQVWEAAVAACWQAHRVSKMKQKKTKMHACKVVTRKLYDWQNGLRSLVHAQKQHANLTYSLLLTNTDALRPTTRRKIEEACKVNNVSVTFS